MKVKIVHPEAVREADVEYGSDQHNDPQHARQGHADRLNAIAAVSNEIAEAPDYFSVGDLLNFVRDGSKAMILFSKSLRIVSPKSSTAPCRCAGHSFSITT